MRLIVLSFAMFMATGALTLAAAQTAESQEAAKISAAEQPVASQSIPDWYQRFSTSDIDDGYANWTGRIETDVKLNLTANPRWNVNLGLTSREGDKSQTREEIWAGATFNITSRLSIGGAVGLGGDDLGPGAEWGEQRLETGIRLQSAYKF